MFFPLLKNKKPAFRCLVEQRKAGFAKGDVTSCGHGYKERRSGRQCIILINVTGVLYLPGCSIPWQRYLRDDFHKLIICGGNCLRGLLERGR